MADTVWFQIVVLFDGFFRYSVLFLVFTSIMYFFCNFLSNPPQKSGPKGWRHKAGSFSAGVITSPYRAWLRLNAF